MDEKTIIKDKLTQEELQALLNFVGRDLSVVITDKEGDKIRVNIICRKNTELKVYTLLEQIKSEFSQA